MGNDTLNGGPGADIMRGGVGNDNYYIDAADNIAELANQGVDHVFAAFSHQLGANFEHLTLLGAFNVNATGNGVANTLTGNSGNNVLDGRAGADVMRGGAGNDTYIVDNAGDQITENAGEGVDTVQSSVTWTLGANLENLVLTGMAAINGVGNAANNDITGNGAANILNGGAGADIMRGGDGNDRYYVNIAGDQVIENDNEGTDGVFSSVSYALGAFIENLALTGAANINGVGNGLANRITGNSGANIINGLNGLDILTGGAGGDVFVFSTALGPTNIDQITDFNPVNDRIALDDAIFTAAGAAGALAAGAFRIGAAATDADDRILYDSASGQLLYDADGNGGGAAEHFATLSAGLALTASDFFII